MSHKKDENSLSHALHNSNACDVLQKQGGFNDWVITTAFYSAIHFIHYKLFPGQYEVRGNTVLCKNFYDYYKKISTSSNSHSAREDCVRDHLREINVDYSTLREMCDTARYNNYQMSDEQRILALLSLKSIKETCTESAIDIKQK